MDLWIWEYYCYLHHSYSRDKGTSRHCPAPQTQRCRRIGNPEDDSSYRGPYYHPTSCWITTLRFLKTMWSCGVHCTLVMEQNIIQLMSGWGGFKQEKKYKWNFTFSSLYISTNKTPFNKMFLNDFDGHDTDREPLISD